MKTNNKYKVVALIGLVCLTLAACGGVTGMEDIIFRDPPVADYGDAPDSESILNDLYPGRNLIPQFPSLSSSNGAHHNDPTKAALGMPDEDNNWPGSAEKDANDMADPDGLPNIDIPTFQFDQDAKDDGLLKFSFRDDEETTLDFAVTTSADSPFAVYYLNVLFDWNKDGKWEGLDANGASEWAVKNQEVVISPNESGVFTSLPFLTGVSAHPVWMRMTLSEQPIVEDDFPNGWDGTGTFAYGETEDYYLDSHEVISLEDADGQGVPGVPSNPFNPRPGPGPAGGGAPWPFPFPGGGGGGGGGGNNDCEEYYYYNVTLCKGKSVTKLLTIGGFAPDSIEAYSADPSIASVSLNEANVTITGNEEGTTTIHIVATQGDCTFYVTVSVTVKKCERAPRVRIECCSPEQIRRDPSLCKNCRIVGRQWNQSNTHGGAVIPPDTGTIPETSMEGVKTNVSKSFVLVRPGGLVDILTIYYECDPCPEKQMPANWLDEVIKYFFSLFDHSLFGGANGLIDNYDEYDALRLYYDEDFDDTSYECVTRYLLEMSESETGTLVSLDETASDQRQGICYVDENCEERFQNPPTTKEACKFVKGKSWSPLDSDECIKL